MRGLFFAVYLLHPRLQGFIMGLGIMLLFSELGGWDYLIFN